LDYTCKRGEAEEMWASTSWIAQVHEICAGFKAADKEELVRPVWEKRSHIPCFSPRHTLFLCQFDFQSFSALHDNDAAQYGALFRYLGTTVTNQNLIQKEIKRRLNSGNHSTQNLLSSRLLSKNVKIRIYKNIILQVVLYGC
jgi:hypothetical protein